MILFRGLVQGIESRAAVEHIMAESPLRAIFGYSTARRRPRLAPHRLQKRPVFPGRGRAT
jgi:hypothetical protein